MSKRTEMLSSIIREVVSPILHQCIPFCGIVSITEIDVSTDMAHATVYLSALDEHEDVLGFMQKKRAMLQRELHGALQRKKVPQIRFRMDPRPERGARIEELLDQSN